MTNDPFFAFTVDKERQAIQVKRIFRAGPELVWLAWTTPSLLDQWWAPKPYRTETKHLECKTGGHWLYAMIGPENDAHWCRADFTAVTANKYFEATDAFCDADGKVNSEFPVAHWKCTFTTADEGTLVSIQIAYNSTEDLEKYLSLGFSEGFTSALGNLDQYIESQFRLRAAHKTDLAPRVATYLNFPGNTEAAFLFYRSVFQSEFLNGITRFDAVPQAPGAPPVAESVKAMVLHIELPITGGHILMGTDAPAEMGFTVTQGNNMHIQIEPDSRAEAKRIFEALSAEGNVAMDLQDMFWGAYFGSFTDKFGINWMINCMAKE